MDGEKAGLTVTRALAMLGRGEVPMVRRAVEVSAKAGLDEAIGSLMAAFVAIAMAMAMRMAWL